MNSPRVRVCGIRNETEQREKETEKRGFSVNCRKVKDLAFVRTRRVDNLISLKRPKGKKIEEKPGETKGPIPFSRSLIKGETELAFAKTFGGEPRDIVLFPSAGSLLSVSSL